ncbi:MAG: DUF1904 domain-containing protein [Desulfuromonadales bacterium]|nr:DUF1904 domain-containing protein [Desulfuromonadales bacterium]
MPAYIKVMNLNKEQMAEVAKNTLSNIAQIAGQEPESEFHFIHCSDLIFDNDSTPFVYIEISWFARNMKKMQGVSKLLYDEISKYGNCNVNVVFQELKLMGNLFENGEWYWSKPRNF